MPVRQVSSSDSSVGLDSPRSVCVSSRLRWLAGGRSSRSLARSTLSVCTWASAWLWVCSANASSAPAAACASGRSCALKPARLATCNCAHSLRAPSAASNCHAGRCVMARPAAGHGRGQRIAVGAKQLGGIEPRQPGRQFGFAAFGQAQPAAGQAQPGQAEAGAFAGDRKQQGILALGQQFVVGDRAGRDDAHHLALDRALGRCDVAHLFGNRDRHALLDELGQVALERVHRHAGHHHRLAGRGAARGQRDVEQAVGLSRVVVEDLVEVTHAKEQQAVRVLGLQAQVLRHDGRVGGDVHARCTRTISRGRWRAS